MTKELPESLREGFARVDSKDSLEKRKLKKFETGSVRSNYFDNFRYDLISPIGLRRVAEAYKEGADKYGDFNWEKGMPIGDLLNHVIAHIYNYLSGDRSEDHLGHAAWGVMAACHSEESWPDLNDNLRKQTTISKK